MNEPLNDPLPGGESSTPGELFSTCYEKCIACKDLGVHCSGIKLEHLRSIANVRAYHKRLRNERKISMRQIFAITTDEISDATVKDYFGSEKKDFHWTTVALIDRALVSLCGGVSYCHHHACPATATAVRSQLEAQETRIQHADSECEYLRNNLAEQGENHKLQLDQMQQYQQERIDWLKADIRLWRKIAFALLGVLLIVLAALFVYIGWDITHPHAGFIQH